MGDILENISNKYGSFTRSQKLVANFVQENINSIAFDTLDDLALRIQVSTTTIIRFSRSLGYTGYTDMQRDIQSYLKDKISLPERLTIPKAQSSKSQMLKESFQNDINNIQETLSTLRAEDLERTVSLLSQAENVYLIGMRGAFSLAYYAASRLGQLRHNVRLIQSSGMLYPEEISSVKKGDVCLAFFFPRYSKMTANMLAWLKKREVTVILVTSQFYQQIASYGDIIFPCSIKGGTLKNSYAAPVCLINYLVSAYANGNLAETKDSLGEIEELLSQGYCLGL